MKKSPKQFHSHERGHSLKHDEIARRAFELYAARGGRHGSDLADWLQAEQELRGVPGHNGRMVRADPGNSLV